MNIVHSFIHQLYTVGLSSFSTWVQLAELCTNCFSLSLSLFIQRSKCKYQIAISFGCNTTFMPLNKDQRTRQRISIGRLTAGHGVTTELFARHWTLDGTIRLTSARSGWMEKATLSVVRWHQPAFKRTTSHCLRATVSQVCWIPNTFARLYKIYAIQDYIINVAGYLQRCVDYITRKWWTFQFRTVEKSRKTL